MSFQTLPSVADMFNGKASRYALVIAVSKRAREIVSEHELRGEELIQNAVVVASEEFKNKECDIDYLNKNNE